MSTGGGLLPTETVTKGAVRLRGGRLLRWTSVDDLSGHVIFPGQIFHEFGYKSDGFEIFQGSKGCIK